jgi:hypothetical protein
MDNDVLRKILLVYILLTLLIPVVTQNVRAATAEVVFSMSSDDYILSLGDSCIISIFANSGTNVINTLAILNLTFSTNRINVDNSSGKNVSYCESLSGFFNSSTDVVTLDANLSETGGYLSNAIWSTNSTHAKSGSGYVCNITFNATSSGLAYINLTSTGACLGLDLNITAVLANITLTVSEIVPESSGNISINDTLGIGTTNATLFGFLYNHSDDSSTVPCGFAYDIKSKNNLSGYDNNIIYGDVANMSSFSQKISNLTPGEYYYARAWQHLAGGFNLSSEGYFLTKPTVPTNFSASVSGTDMLLTWDPSVVGSGTTQRTIIRYSKTSQPTDISSGTEGYNGTSDHYTFSNPDYGSLYYFTAFSFINCSGSPNLFQVSSNYTAINATSFTGEYNITLRYENTTHQLVNTTTGVYHEFVVVYSNRTEVNLFNATGFIPNPVTPGNWTNATNGTWNITCLSPPLWFEFHWNETHLNPYVTEGDLKAKSEYATIFNSSANTTNNLSYTPETIVTVSVYNSTSSYPRWVEITSEMYDLTDRKLR